MQPKQGKKGQQDVLPISQGGARAQMERAGIRPQGSARLVGVVINGPKYFWNTEITARLAYCDNNKETKTVVKERQVPYQVQVETVKKREVLKTQEIPFWELLLQGDAK